MDSFTVVGELIVLLLIVARVKTPVLVYDC